MDEQKTPPEIGVGMLGYAFMGKAHSNAYKKLPYMVYPPPALPKLVGIAGRDAARVEEAARRYGYARHYTDWRKMLADPEIQLFDNGAPNDLHAEPCIFAAESGKHILCEKPLGRTREEAARMLEAAQKAKVKHMVAFNYRFVPAIRLVYELIQSGALGEIYHFRASYLQGRLSDPSALHTWRHNKERAGTGALGDLGSHIIDIARFLVGEPRSVMAKTRTFIKERPLSNAPDAGKGTVDVDDAFVSIMEFGGNTIGTLEATRLGTGRQNQLVFEINAAKGSVRFNMERMNELEVFWKEEDTSTGLKIGGFSPARLTEGFRTVLVSEAYHPFWSYWWPRGHIIGWEHTFVHEIAHFLEVIVGDKEVAPYGATFEDGYRNAVVCEAILHSAENGQHIKVDY